MSRVWRFYFKRRGRYTELAGRIEYALYRHSRAYRRFYEAELARRCGVPGCWCS